MEKKTILALVLIMIIFWISNEFIWKKQAQQPVTEEPAVTSEEVIDPVDEEVKEEAIETSSELKITPTDPDLNVNDDILLENETIAITFSNLGGVITSVIMKDYFFNDQLTNVDLIPADEDIFNIELETEDENRINLSRQVFDYLITENGSSITFSLSSDAGTIYKKYTLNNNYNISLRISTENFSQLSSYVISMDSGIADSEDYIIDHPKEKLRDYKIIAEINNEIEKYSLSKLKNKKDDIGKIDWAAIRSKYFIIGIFGDELVDVNRIESFNNNNTPAMELSVAIPRDSFSHNFNLYFGPLVREELAAFRPGFEKVLEGPFIEILRPISNIFAAIFKFFRGFIPNYGIIIIIIAVLLKILLYPLTHKSFESTHKMQKVTPLMKELQAKYKNDPQTLNKEMRKLYKEHGVSPLGGCLPMLLQMPIIFAIYPVIRYSIDMRQNAFLWLADLSEPDKTLILPIAMAVFMFVQQKLMSPSKDKLAEMDEKQRAAQQSQKMMLYIMPVMMFFIFKSLSAGLVLYWTVFSIIGTIQQYFIKKKFV
jgi:YidC/Oxa1 family membrane protein insertase